MMDFYASDHEWVLDVTVVSQHDVTYTYGMLRGVDPSGCSIDEGYRTDTRASAKITTVVPEGESDGYVKYARLRMMLSVPSRDWSEVLFTGFVTDVKEDTKNGATTRTYELDSTLYGIAEDPLPWQLTCGAGSSMLVAARSLLDMARMPHDLGGASDKRFGAAIAYEVGDTILHMLFDMTSGVDRVDVDGHGRITLRPYVSPSLQTPTQVIDERSPRTLLLDKLSHTSKELENPGRVIVTSHENNATIAGWYDAPQGHPSSSSVRGYTIGRKESWSGDIEKPTQSDLSAKAKQTWSESQGGGGEWSCSVLYMGLHEGHVVDLWTKGATSAVKCLVATCKTDIGDMTQSLTLEEVA